MEHPFQSLLLQIVIILVAARLCGMVLRRLGQPQVIGEMLAGIMLGPSLLGLLQNGAVMNALFPKSARAPLDMLSQLGVVLFMFLVGLELDLARVLRQGSAVLYIAVASMIVPFAAGVGLALVLQTAGFGPEIGGSQAGFILFVATALSITAFPVLARILTAANLNRTPAGLTAIACAALNDVAGWCLLAVVFALVKAGAQAAAADPARQMRDLALTIGGAILYLLIMLFLLRPALRRLLDIFKTRGALPPDLLAAIFVLLALSSLATDYIGIHALFGAFMLGAVMPSDPKFVAHLAGKLEDLVTLFLLPLYFAYTGLNTNLGLLASPRAWAMALLVTLAATLSKIGGTYLAARFSKVAPRPALALGVLMNTRGLMELVILNLALEVHAITPEVFSLFVIMTLITTLMTTPLIKRLETPIKAR